MKKKVTHYTEPQSFIGNSVLVLAPHQDDETLGCGGSIILHRKKKDPVQVVFLSDGSGGDFTHQYSDNSKYVLLRNQEAKKACKTLGAPDPIFLGFKDGALEKSRDQIVERLKPIVTQHKPTLIYAPHFMDGHPDHQTTAHVAWTLGRQFPSIQKILFFEVSYPLTLPNAFVDVTSTTQKKAKACAQYKSQIKVYRYAKSYKALNQYRSLFLAPKIKEAEAFLKVERSAFSQPIDQFFLHLHFNKNP